MMFKIVNKECPGYFTSYKTYIKIPIAITRDYLHASATHLWNRLDDKLRNMTNESNFKKTFAREILKH